MDARNQFGIYCRPTAWKAARRNRNGDGLGKIAFWQACDSWVGGGSVKPMTEACIFFINSPIAISPFQGATFYKTATLTLTSLKDLYTRNQSVEHASFQSFVVVKLQALQGPSKYVSALLLNNIHLCDYDLQDVRNGLESTAFVWQRRLITGIRKSRVPCNEETKKVLDVISATNESRQLRLKRLNERSQLQRREEGDRR